MTRDDALELLPFLANETLEAEERAALEALVADDAEMQAELAALRAIRDTMQAEDAGFSPGEIGLARLMRDVETEAPAPQITPPMKRPVLWQIAAAFLLAVVVGQAFVMTQNADTGGLELAGGTDAAFEITIVPDAAESEIRALLLDAGVEIVAGPSALGIYQLSPIEGVTDADARGILAASDLIESLSDPSE